MMPVRTYDGRNGILIDESLAGEDILVSGTVLIRPDNEGLDMQGYLGIRDDRRRQESVRMAAGLAKDSCNPELEDRILLSKLARIASVPDKTAKMAAGTGKKS